MTTKDQIYSWRLRRDLKQALEEAARAQRMSLAGLLERITSHWLERQQANGDDVEVQRRLHAAAAESLGSIRGGDPHRAEQAHQRLRDKLARRHAR